MLSSIIKDSYISYVNLDHRLDRKARMEKVLKEVGIEAVRTRGILPQEYKGDQVKVQKMRERTPGAIGCHYAQVSIMEEACRQDKHAFVMEDDLIFCKDFWARMEIIEDFLAERKWDILWLGGTFHIGNPHWHKNTIGRDAETTDNPRMMKTYGAFSTFAYIVNRASLWRIIPMLEENVHTSIGIDWLFIQLQPRLQTFAFVPGCVIQHDNISDIGGRGRNISHFSNFSKIGRHWYQERMEQFDPAGYDWKEARIGK